MSPSTTAPPPYAFTLASPAVAMKEDRDQADLARDATYASSFSNAARVRRSARS